MARLLDFYDLDNANGPNWVQTIFPGNSANVPDETGIYRFVSHHAAEKQTLFIEDTCSSQYGENVRACYFYHSSVSGDAGDNLADLYATQGLVFEHFICGEEEAKRHRHIIVTKLPPPYKPFNLFIADIPNKNPFDN